MTTAASESTLNEVALELGVHYMTAYRWVRTGQLIATKDGATWKVNAQDLEDFKLGRNAAKPAQGKTSTASSGGRTKSPDLHIERLVSALRKGDDASSYRLLETAISNGWSAEEAQLVLLSGAMRRVGELWQRDELSVSEEHQATVVAYRCIGRLSPHFARRGRQRKTVLLGAPALDLHGLPTALMAGPIRGRRHKVTELGANTPDFAWLEAIDATTNLGAIGMTVSSDDATRVATETIAAIRDQAGEVTIVVGGPGVHGDEGAELMRADTFASTALDAIEMLTDSDD